MSWVSIVLYILMHIQEIIGVIKSVIALIKGMPKPQSEAVRGMFSDAIQHHKETKDASRVKQLCVGIGCAPELVG